MMIAISLLGLFMGTVYESVIMGLRVVSASDSREDVRLQLAKTLDRFTREATMIGSASGNLTTATATQCTFNADLNGDGTVETTGITYWQNGSGVFERTQTSPVTPAVTLVQNLTSVTFDYLDSTGAVLAKPVTSQATRDTIRVIEITITAARNNETLSLAGAVYLRNK